MARPRSPLSEEAARLVALDQFKDVPTRTLGRRLAKQFKCSIQDATNKISYYRGVSGKRNRKYSTQPKEHGSSGWKPKLPPSSEEPWEPVELGPGKIACISDIHIPYHSETALKAALKYCKRRKPDTLLINGDALDFYRISRWIKDPRERKFSAELDMGRDFFAYLRSQFPKARIIFKLGNHEERWNVYLWNNAPEICDLPHVQLDNILELPAYGIEMVDEGRPIMAGKLPILHGHELPKGLTNPVNMARGAYLRMADTVLVGHGHRSSSHTEPNWKHEEVTCWSQGCLCGLTPKYARINKWNHGFAFVTVMDDLTFDMENLRISKDGKVRTS